MLTVHRASAGSGKTFTLAREYIRLLLGRFEEGNPQLFFNYDPKRGCAIVPCRHRGILAITFTRKATEEMKTRILKELRILTDPSKKSDHREFLRQCFDVTDDVLAAAAACALQQLLFDYGNFNVSTIDAFFQRVLHTFARELDRQSDYDIEMDDEAIMHLAVNEMLDDFNASPTAVGGPLENWIYDYISENVDEGKKGNFFNRRSPEHTELVKALTSITKEAFRPSAQQMKAYLEKGELDNYKKKLKEHIAGTPGRLIALVRASITDEMVGYMKKGTNAVKILNLCLEGAAFDIDPKWSKNETMAKLAKGESPTFNKGKGTPAQAQAVRDTLQAIIFELKQRDTALAILQAMPFLGLLAHCWKYLDIIGKENNVLLMSDTNELVKRIIDHDDAPFIYERMGCRLSHFLIDEFQDTSKMQWDNLRPLVANGLGQGRDSLVIGDEKQAIYRFRNSDSSILRTTVEADLGAYLDPNAHLPQTNYRSAAGIVKFNNTIFSIMSAAQGLKDYGQVVQNIFSKNLGLDAYVRLIETATLKKDDAAKRREIYEQMAQQILRQHNEGGYAWKDIAVLVYKNKEAIEIVDFLITEHSADICVLSDEALRLVASPAVRMVINILKSIDRLGAEPKIADESVLDKKQLSMLRKAKARAVLMRYEFQLSAMIAKASAEGVTLDADSVGRLAIEALRLATDEAGSLSADATMEALGRKPSSLTALVEAVIAALFSEEERDKNVLYLAALQDVVLEFAQQGTGSLHEFIDWWDKHSNSITVPGSADTDAVRVMTIHKAKGLEFDCVHLPLCNWTMLWHSLKPPMKWVDTPAIGDISPEAAPPVLYMPLTADCSDPDSPLRDEYEAEARSAMADNMNKTYVAFTRAARELQVWYYKKNGDTHSVATCISEAIQQGLPATPDPDLMVNLKEHWAKVPEPEPAEAEEGADPAAAELDAAVAEPEPDTLQVVSILEIGRPTEHKSRTKDEADADLPEPVDMPLEYPITQNSATQAILTVADSLSELRSYIPSDTERVESKEPAPGADGDSEDVRKLGVMMHDMMGRMQAAAELPAAVETQANICRLSEPQRQECLSILSAHIAQAAAMGMPWYDPELTKRAYVEQPIFCLEEQKDLRPDRVVVLPDGGAHVIDYKFTANPERVLADGHTNQVRGYGRLLQSLGYGPVRAFLAYPRLGKIEEVALY